MKNKKYNSKWFSKFCATILLLTFGCLLLDFAAKANGAKNEAKNEYKKASSPGIVSTMWTLQKEDAKVRLITLNDDPILITIQPETLIAGMCVHCNLVMEIKAGQNAKNCTKCACSLSNTECFLNKVAGKNGWADMLKAMPPGTALLVEYLDAGKPQSGLKRLTIDYKTVLLPIKSASSPSAEDLKAAVRAVGGTSVELGDEGKRLLIHLKNDWTQDKEIRLAKSLAQIGVAIDFPAQETAAK